MRKSGSNNYIQLRVEDSKEQRAYVSCWDNYVFSSINIKGDSQSIQQQLMIHIGNKLKLHLNVITKKGTGEISSTYYNLVNIIVD
jgi:hypothetical protein